MLEPFELFVEDWASRWSLHGVEGKSAQVVATEYVELLYDFCDDHRHLMRALLAESTRDATTDESLDELFARLEQTVREAADEFALPARDPAMTVRLTFGLVLSAVVHAGILFPCGPAPTRARLIEELAYYIIDGISRPG